MPKINFVTLLGVILVLSGLTGSWFSLDLVDSERRRNWNTDLSPFMFTIEISWINDPTNEIIQYHRYYFYDANTSFVGMVCILGATISFFGGIMERWKLIMLGGVMVLFSNIENFE